MLPAIIGGAFSIAGGIMGAASAKKQQQERETKELNLKLS